MNEQNRKQIILLAVLGAVAAGVVAYQFLFAGGAAPAPSKAAPKAEGSAAKNTAAAKTQLAATTKLQAVDVDVDELLRGIKIVTFDYEQQRVDRNPMTPLVGYVRPGELEPAIQPGTLLDVRRKRVTGIVYDARDPVAIVDDEIVAPGFQYPDGIRVQAIEPNRVVFQVGDTLVPVEMKEL
jgi:hypothetical protein